MAALLQRQILKLNLPLRIQAPKNIINATTSVVSKILVRLLQPVLNLWIFSGNPKSAELMYLWWHCYEVLMMLSYLLTL